MLTKAGLNHRPVKPRDRMQYYDEYQRVLVPFIALHANLSARCLSTAMCLCFDRMCDARRLFDADGQDDSSRLQQGIQGLKHSACVVLPSDKAKNQPVYMCRAMLPIWYVRTWKTSGCYACVVTEPDVQTFMDQVHAHIPAVQFPTEVKWAAMFPLYKPHKGNFRFITDCANIFVTEFSLLIHKMVNLVFDAQCEYCRDLCRELASVYDLHVRLDNVVPDYITAALNFP
jgi:hypothetical protein